jgi:hypothetical protein
LRLPAIFLWGGKTCCTLIATPNVDNANRRQKLNYKLHVILMQKGTVVFVFANYLDDVLVWNYAMSGFNRITATGTDMHHRFSQALFKLNNFAIFLYVCYI